MMRLCWPFRKASPSPAVINCLPDDDLCHDLRNALIQLQQDRKQLLRECGQAIKTIEQIIRYALALKTPMQRIQNALARRADGNSTQ
jgi:hypothetical protein